MLKAQSLTHRIGSVAIAVFLCACSIGNFALGADPDRTPSVERGQTLYHAHCVSCHGVSGEGVSQKYDEPLYGDLSLSALAEVIDRTMPDQSPEHCSGDDARDVAAYMISQFYTVEARVRNQPPRIALARMTAEQFSNTLCDLVSQVERVTLPKGKPGLTAKYYSDRNRKKEKLVVERSDLQIDFDFGKDSPDKKIKADEFSILWTGSVVADVSGEYEFIVSSGNGFRLYVNDTNEMLIDGWVSSGGTTRELSGTVHLLAGRAYRLHLEFFKYGDKTSSIRLMWKPPRGVVQLIPSRNLRTDSPRTYFIASTHQPPDDASFGYPRGTSVSKSWDEATTDAILEAATDVGRRIDSLAGTQLDAPDRKQKVQDFCQRFAQRAMRRPLTDQQKLALVDAYFEATTDPAQAARQCVIRTLKSADFLYPNLPSETPGNFDVASRISYALWDSLPDNRLFDRAKTGKLQKESDVRNAVVASMDDARTHAKLRGFFHHWLSLERSEGMSKDQELYPQFSDALIADLRMSLDLFLDEVFWGDSPDYRRLLLSDAMYVNQRIAEYYKIPCDQKLGQDQFVSVSLKGQPRAGVVTHPLVLAALAYHNNTSPIHRGVFVTRNLLGRTLNPPPMATVFEEAAFDPHLTMREKVTRLTKPAQCQGCHQVINPLGFSLEQFDAVGQFRTREQEREIEFAADYESVSGKVIRLEGARDLALYAAESETAQRGFIRQLFEHFIKQPPAAYGADSIDRLHQKFVASRFNVRQLLVEIVTLASVNPS